MLTAAGLVTAALVGAVVFDVTRRAGSMRPAKTSADSVLQARPGQGLKAVVRLEGTPRADVYTAELLESVDGTIYRATPNHLQIALLPETEVVMGSAADVRPGAVVQVAGTIDREHTIRAKRIVILTGFISVAG